jgi:hypothetical protein
MFPHRILRTSPDGQTHNQINHILIDRRSHSSKLDVQFFRRADSDTDHCLVVAKVRKRPTVSKMTAQTFDVEGFNTGS